MSSKQRILMFGCLAVFGAGCWSGPSSQTPSPSQTNPPSPTSGAPVRSPDETATSTLPIPTLSTQPLIDATWSTHLNQALKFSFKSPTRGSYAPTWEVKFFPEGNAQLASGCLVSRDAGPMVSTERVQVNDVDFCHTRYEDHAAGNTYLSDHFATKQGKQFIVITFTKHVYSSGALNCRFSSTIAYTSSPTGCIPFETDEYQRVLNVAISTFVYVSIVRPAK